MQLSGVIDCQGGCTFMIYYIKELVALRTNGFLEYFCGHLKHNDKPLQNVIIGTTWQLLIKLRVRF